MVTIVYKMYKKEGKVLFSSATRWVEIENDIETGLSLYPVAHFIWEEKKGSARGEGEVRYLIPNQIEVNRTEMTITARNNGAQMIFCGLDDVEKIKSITPQSGTLTDVWIEEATEIAYTDFKQLDKRLREDAFNPAELEYDAEAAPD